MPGLLGAAEFNAGHGQTDLALFEAGLICRADDRGDPVVQLSPPLICGPTEIEFIVSTLREVLTEAWRRM